MASASADPKRIAAGRVILVLASLIRIGGPARAADPPDLAQAARLAQNSTVTLRVLARPQDSGSGLRPGGTDGDPQATGDPSHVTVFSGVSVTPRLIATSSYVAQGEIRVTLSGGKQALGRLKAVDQYSQLSLVEVVDAELTPSVLDDEQTLQVGQWVISAAAWGAEPAVVSLGIVSGLERRLEGADLPPLLQCDLRSAATSGGAGVFDPQGRLVGMVLAVEGTQARPGWTYAAPVKHVRRLLRALEEQRSSVRELPQDPGPVEGQAPVIVLKRLRPTMGMVLENEEERVVVRRIQPNSPARRAGLIEGDEVVAVNGLQIRSVYQAVRPVLIRQPGDSLQLLIRRKQAMLQVEVVLGGAEATPSDSGFWQAGMQPRVEVSRGAASRPAATEAVAANEQDLANLAARDPVVILQRALDAYRAALDAQQQQLRQTQAALEQAQRELRTLKEQHQPEKQP